ncbi:hypothetical protein BGZ65_001818 [Modicella reniformis]|uniref:Leucine-rich repeat and WD repeat-containing protein 1 WD domain-containing protein n=1 Tax=Modicella reniformis TaxID=1440133 RepID=A0A9P6SNA9_9FUNG|nr:hypothetical protein BGZ65_001818 [Modicella reniformis]
MQRKRVTIVESSCSDESSSGTKPPKKLPRSRTATARTPPPPPTTTTRISTRRHQSSTSEPVPVVASKRTKPTATGRVPKASAAVTAVVVPSRSTRGGISEQKAPERPTTRASAITTTTTATTRATTTTAATKSKASQKPAVKASTSSTRKTAAASTASATTGVRKKSVAKAISARKIHDGTESGYEDNIEEEENIDNPIHGHGHGQEDSEESITSTWKYPDLLDPTNTPSTDATDMDDVNQTKGFVLDYILRGHSRNTHEGQDEDETDTWAAAFQPTLPVIRSGLDIYMTDNEGTDQESSNDSEDPNTDDDDDDDDNDDDDGDGDDDMGKRLLKKRSRQIAKDLSRKRKKSSSIVATCGSNTICLIDCRLGKVMAKYSHVQEEEFMCLAWTTLDHTYGGIIDGNKNDHVPKENRHGQTNILAAAGRMGSIKLINPLQNTCYKYLHGHTDCILRLKFSLTNPRWLFSASMDGTARLWDIGSISNYETEACCLATFVGLDDSSVTAIGVSEKYLIVGTANGLMVQYNLFELNKHIEQNRGDAKKQMQTVQPERIYPASQEWHESALDDIVYIPYFSEKSYTVIKNRNRMESESKSGTNKDKDKDKNKNKSKSNRGQRAKGKAASKKGKEAQRQARGGRGGRGSRGARGARGARGVLTRCEDESSEEEEEEEKEKDDDDDIDAETEFVFASRENCQGEIIVWNATKSTKTDADLKTILDWSIAESWSKFTLVQNRIKISRKTDPNLFLRNKSWKDQGQNVLIAGSTDGKVVMFDLGCQPKRKRDGNIIAAKPTNQ